MQKTFLSHFSMATANAGDAEAKCRNPECPIGVLTWEQIRSHIKKSRICQVFYSVEELEPTVSTHTEFCFKY